MTRVLFDHETMGYLDTAPEPDVSEVEERPRPLTALTDDSWQPVCREHPAWLWEQHRQGRMPPVRPPASACPFCSERQAPPEAPSSMSEFERDPAKALNRAAPPAARGQWSAKDQRRRTWERAMLERNAEIRELEALLEADAPSGGGYVPPGPMAYKTHNSPYMAKRKGKRLKAAKARLAHLLSTPLDLPSETTYHDGRDEMWTVQG